MVFAGAVVKTVEQVAEEKAAKNAKEDAIANYPKVSPLKHKSALVTVNGQKAMKVHIRTKDMEETDPDMDGFLWFTPMENLKTSYRFHFAKAMDEVGDGDTMGIDVRPLNEKEQHGRPWASGNGFTNAIRNAIHWRTLKWHDADDPSSCGMIWAYKPHDSRDLAWTLKWRAPDPKNGYDQARVELKMMTTGNKVIILEEDWEDLLTLWEPNVK